MGSFGRTSAVLGTVSVLLALAAPASAAPPGTPPRTGCPAGSLVLSVEQLEAEGPYRVPRRVDQEGNQDGLVCGHPLEPVAAERSVCGGPCPAPIYLFRDNDLVGRAR